MGLWPNSFIVVMVLCTLIQAFLAFLSCFRDLDRLADLRVLKTVFGGTQCARKSYHPRMMHDLTRLEIDVGT